MTDFPQWLNDSTPAGLLCSAVWLQADAAYLHKEMAKKRDEGGEVGNWLAKLYQENTAHSARMARECMLRAYAMLHPKADT